MEPGASPAQPPQTGILGPQQAGPLRLGASPYPMHTRVAHTQSRGGVGEHGTQTGTHTQVQARAHLTPEPCPIQPWTPPSTEETPHSTQAAGGTGRTLPRAAWGHRLTQGSKPPHTSLGLTYQI